MVQDQLFHHLQPAESQSLMRATANRSCQMHRYYVQLSDALAVCHAEYRVNCHIMNPWSSVARFRQQFRKQTLYAPRDFGR